MNIDELRIGVTIKLQKGILDGGVATIRTKDDLLLACDMLEKGHIFPIKLNGEELNRLGFRVYEGNGYYDPHFDFVIFWIGDRWVMYHHSEVDGATWFIRYIEYVHEIQNIYAAIDGMNREYIL